MSEFADLPSLLSNTLNGLEAACAEQGAGRAGLPSVDEWANLLRAIDKRGTDPRDLPRLLRLSKRAVHSRTATAVRRGWVCSDSNEKSIALTTRGSEISKRWHALEAAAEEQWRRRIGSAKFEKLRSSLEQIVARLPLERPHYPASYGPADASVTGGNGQEWRTVLRDAQSHEQCIREVETAWRSHFGRNAWMTYIRC